MKKKRILLTVGLVLGIPLVCALLFAYMAFVRGFYAASEKMAGTYTGAASISFLGEKECYRIVANKYGEPIFENPAAAFRQASSDYNEVIQLIYETFHDEYDFGLFSPKCYQMYLLLGWQIPTHDENIRKQGSNLTKFLDFYENSEKRWFLTPCGWVRE